MPSPPVEAYHVGVVCALPKEMAAASAMLDEEHEQLKIVKDGQDTNGYVLGRVHEHNVAIACLPAGVYGTNAAAMVATNMLRTFREIRFGLMVGIGGGIPNLAKKIDIRLGDVVVSQPDRTFGGVVQYDLGKNLGEGIFELKGHLAAPPADLLTALSIIQSKPGTSRRRVSENVSAMIQTSNLADEEYHFPGIDRDELFCAGCDRSQWWWMTWLLLFLLNMLWPCKICDKGKILRSLDRTRPKIHYGTIASGNSLIKNAAQRDRLGEKLSARCVEMEAAGLMNGFPCIVIRGICDYADSHTDSINDPWQKYASVTAAAFAKELLFNVRSTHVDAMAHAIDAMNRTHELLDESNQLQKQGIEIHHEQSKKSDEQYQNKRKEQCHRAFKTSTYEQYKTMVHDRAPGTCKWMLEDRQFQSWQESKHNELLWISADPGCGKSVLSKSLVDHEFGNVDQYSVCYFFFKDNGLQDNLSTALCAILHQLFDRQPSLLCHALPAWEKNDDKIQQEIGEMWRILLAAVADPSAQPVICVLDALDECRDNDRQQLVTKLCEFYQQSSGIQSGARLKFLVTSRPYDNVQRWFQEKMSDLPQIRLRGEDKNDQIHDEINLVIGVEVSKLAGQFSLSEHHQAKLEDRLKQMKHRTYLWLHLALEEIRDLYRDTIYPNDVEVESLPTSVQDAYERILSKIQDKQRVTARRMLLIIAGARRPLTIGEMAHALGAAQAHELDQSAIRKIDPERLQNQIRDLCGLFVFINHSQLFLIHQTAKEFLVAEDSDHNAVTGKWKSAFSHTEIESGMAKCCVTFLYLYAPDRQRSDDGYNRDKKIERGEKDDGEDEHNRKHGEHGDNDDEGDDSRQDDQTISTEGSPTQPQNLEVPDKFFEYCAMHWTSHLRDDTVLQDKKLLEMVLSLYTVNGNRFDAWFHILWHSSSKYYDQPPTLKFQHDQPPKLKFQHVVSMSDHLSVLNEGFHRDSFDLEARDSEGRTALHWASYRGHEAVVNWLIQSGADVNTQAPHHGGPLHDASSEGHYKVVRILLDKGADVNQISGRNGTPLYIASHLNNVKLVQILLDKGADVNAQGGSLGNALQAASFSGSEKIVQMLLDKGADVNAQGGSFGNALHAASRFGSEKTVQMLLDKGADVNTQGGFFGNALRAASGSGSEKVVQMLLDKGADINAQGGSSDNALIATSRFGHENVVPILLEAEADVNAPGKRWGSALSIASHHGYEEVVRILLDNGADVNGPKKQNGCRPLRAASKCGHKNIEKMLLERGASASLDEENDEEGGGGEGRGEERDDDQRGRNRSCFYCYRLGLR